MPRDSNTLRTRAHSCHDNQTRLEVEKFVCAFVCVCVFRRMLRAKVTAVSYIVSARLSEQVVVSTKYGQRKENVAAFGEE